MLKSSEICLYLASFKGASGSVDAWVLRLEPKNVASAAETLIETRASVAAAAVTATVVHPDVKLPWFDRRPLSEIRRVPSHDILMKVRLAPCLYVDDEDEICVDGYLLSHGMYNFDLRGKNEKTVATPIALSHSRKFSSATSTSSSSSSSSSSSARSDRPAGSGAASSSAAASRSKPSKEVNGPTPLVGDIIKLDGVSFPVNKVTQTKFVDDNGNTVFFISFLDRHGLRLTNYIRSTEKYIIESGKKKK